MHRPFLRTIQRTLAGAFGYRPENVRRGIHFRRLGCEPLEPRTLLSISSPWSGVFNVYVEPGVLDQIQSSMDTYAADLTAEGYSVTVQEFSGTAAELRTTLQDEWTTNNLEGALLVGDLPYMEFREQARGYTYPHDLYFMDLDGTYVLNDPDWDEHLDGSDDAGPEIYISRITTGNLSGATGKDEVTLINEYFSKVHDYRSGVLQYQDRGIVFRDDDWAGLNFNMDDLYTDVLLVNDPSQTTEAGYLSTLQLDYESMLQCIHSTATSLSVGGVGGGWISSAEISGANPRQGFYNLFSCGSAKFTVDNHLIGAYVYGGDYGLNAIGPTTSGGMMGGFSDYYAPQRAGDSVGQAFMQWFDVYAVPTDSTAHPGWVAWFYPMTMQGDPTLAPASMGSGGHDLIINANDPGGNGMGNGASDDFRLVLNGANLEVYIDSNLCQSLPFANVLSITLNGSADDDTLTVDLGGGNRIPPGGLIFHGGAEGAAGDRLEIQNGAADTVVHTFTEADSGEIDIDGLTITYTGVDGSLEPIHDYLQAVHRVFNFGATDDDVTFSEDDVQDPHPINSSRISSSSGQAVDFQVPSNSLTVNGGSGDDTLTVDLTGAPYFIAAPFNGDGLVFNGGAEGTSGDKLKLQNLQLDTTTHTFTGPDSGRIDFSSAPLCVTYTGLESPLGAAPTVYDNLNISNRKFYFGTADHHITFGDDGVPDDAVSRVTLGSGLIVDFRDPSSLYLRTTADSVTIDGTIENVGNTVTVNVAGSAAEIAGEISGGVGLTKTGAGTLTISGANSYTGPTNVAAGRLNVNGSILVAGTITVANGATLGGTGTAAGPVIVQGGATLAPGLSPGILSTGDLNLVDNSTLDVEIGGTVPGDHDQLVVTGATTIGGNVTLSLSAWDGFVPFTGGEYVLIDNDQDDAVTGAFAGMGEGTIISTDFLSSGQWARITYVGGDGNDVAITLTPSCPGDFNSDGDVDVDDLLAWRVGFGTPSGANLEDGDADSDGDVDGDDFLIWQQNFGTGTGAGSAATLFEQVRSQRGRTVDRVFDEFARRSKFAREKIADTAEPVDEIVAHKLRPEQHRMRSWPGIR